MLKGSKFIKIFLIVAIAAIILLVSFQLYNYFFLTVKTEYAVSATMEDSFDVQGIVCRDEQILKDNYNGYHDLVLADGEKVSKGGTVARVYTKESDVKAQENIRQLQAQIDEYKAAVSAKKSYSGDSTAYEQRIQEAMFALSKALQSGESFAAQEYIDEFKNNVFIKEIVSGETQDHQQLIDDLEAKLLQMQSGIDGSVQNISASQSGYFVRLVDGFESLTKESISELSVDQYNKLFSDVSADTENEDVLGKLVSGYEWQYYFTTTSDFGNDYEIGDTIKLRFDSVSSNIVEGKIVSKKQENGTVLWGVSCSAQGPEFLSVRTLEGKVIAKTYSGIRVDKNAIRIVDGKQGVYVKVGSIIRFKRVEVLYMGTTYALVSDKDGSIVNFDEVVIGGKNIYDGRVLS